MRTIVAILCVILLVLQYKLWFGDNSISVWHQTAKQVDTQMEENQKLSGRNEALRADIVGLKSGDQALEEEARYTLGMVKDTEVYYQFVE